MAAAEKRRLTRCLTYDSLQSVSDQIQIDETLKSPQDVKRQNLFYKRSDGTKHRPAE